MLDISRREHLHTRITDALEDGACADLREDWLEAMSTRAGLEGAEAADLALLEHCVEWLRAQPPVERREVVEAIIHNTWRAQLELEPEGHIQLGLLTASRNWRPS